MGELAPLMPGAAVFRQVLVSHSEHAGGGQEGIALERGCLCTGPGKAAPLAGLGLAVSLGPVAQRTSRTGSGRLSNTWERM